MDSKGRGWLLPVVILISSAAMGLYFGPLISLKFCLRKRNPWELWRSCENVPLRSPTRGGRGQSYCEIYLSCCTLKSVTTFAPKLQFPLAVFSQRLSSVQIWVKALPESPRTFLTADFSSGLLCQPHPNSFRTAQHSKIFLPFSLPSS